MQVPRFSVDLFMETAVKAVFRISKKGGGMNKRRGAAIMKKLWRGSEKEEELSWKKLASEGELIGFRFQSTGHPPTGLVFRVKGGGKVIVRGQKGGELELEHHW